MKSKSIIALVVSLSFSAAVTAEIISIDFNNTTAGAWVVTGSAGPLGSSDWNNTSTSSGGPQALVNDSGAATTATVTWSAPGGWTNGDLNGSEDAKLAHAYLDDGAAGVLVTLNNIPYTDYRVYGLVSSGQNGAAATYTTRDFTVNGSWVLGDTINGNSGAATTAIAHGGVASSGGGWLPILGDGAGTQTATGNYWTYETTGSTLIVDGLPRNGSDRGSLTGLIIEDTTNVPEPSVFGLVIFSAILLTARARRRR